MTIEDKQALIEGCTQRVDALKNYCRFKPDDREASLDLSLCQIALVALTAQPVKLPESFYGVIQDGKVVMLPADDGQWLNKTSVAEAFRSLEQRAEAAEAKLVSCRGALYSLAHVARRILPDYDEHPEIQRADEILDDDSFIRPAPAINLAELVPPETSCIGWVRDEIKEHDKKWLEMLRNIEEAK